MSALPNSWSLARLGDVASEIAYGFTTASTISGTQPKLLRITDIQDGAVKWDAVPRCTDAPDDRALLGAGDIVIARTGATTGKSYLIDAVPEKAVFASYLIRVRLGGQFEPRYAWAFMQSSDYWSQIQTVSKGTAQPGANASILSKLALPVPPLPEQRRIVAKIDSLTGKSSRARNHLDHIPRLVEKYKQAVLAAAFRGDLTREWRTKSLQTISPANILQEIEETRSTLAVARSRSKAIRDDVARIAVALGTVPDSWALTTLENVTDPTRVIQYGILKPGPDVDNGIPYVKVMNIRNERINLDTIRKTSTVIHGQYKRSAIREGDILLTIRGTVGRLAFVPADLDGGNITQDSVRIAVLPVVNPRYVFWYLLGPFAQAYFAANQKGVAVRGINVGDVRPMELPLPSRAEQNEIVRRIEVAIGWIDRLAFESISARRLIDRLDQAVLAKAFRGELVLQDPADEPASALLERIQAERRAAPKVRRGRKVQVRQAGQ